VEWIVLVVMLTVKAVGVEGVGGVGTVGWLRGCWLKAGAKGVLLL